MICKKFFCFIPVLLILSSCATLDTSQSLKKDTSLSSGVINEIKNYNESKFPSKGIASLEIKKGSQISSYTAAFASNGNNKARLELLTPTGLPAVSISFIENKIFLLKHDGSSVKKYSNPKLVTKKLLGFPMDISFLSYLLCQKIPILDYNKSSAFINGEEKKLILDTNDHKTEIFFSDIFLEKQIIVSDKNGSVYLVTLKKDNGFSINAVDKNIKISFIISHKVPITGKDKSDIFMLTR